MQWLVLYLKPRTEKKTAKICAHLGIAHFLPLRRRRVRYPRRVAFFDVPLFPGYLFVGLASPEQRQMLQRAQTVVRYFTPRDRRVFLRQLVQIRRVLRAQPEIGALRTSLSVGQQVRIMAGPFAGVEGRVTSVRDPLTKVYLSVEFMRQSIVIEVSGDALTVLD